jgi:hypothetical protein
LITRLIKVKFSFPIGSYNTIAADKKHPYMVVNTRESSTKRILFFPMKDGCKPKNLCCRWPSNDHQEPLISATIHRQIIAKQKNSKMGASSSWMLRQTCWGMHRSTSETHNTHLLVYDELMSGTHTVVLERGNAENPRWKYMFERIEKSPSLWLRILDENTCLKE